MNNETKRTKISVQDMVQLSVLIAILLLLELTGLGMIKTAGLEITIMLVPVIVGAIVMGPAAGALLGGVFGLISFWECFGKSSFGVVLMGINPFLTFLVCVPTRILAGWICGLVFKGLSKLDKSNLWSFGAAGLCGALSNTALFMSTLCLGFYRTDFIQGFVEGARILSRYCNRIYLALDSDSAGQKAILRDVEILLPMSFDIKVVRIPGGKDPDELFAHGGAAALQQALDDSVSWLKVLCDSLPQRHDMGSAAGRGHAAVEVAGYLNRITNQVELELYVRDAAMLLGVSEDALYAELRQVSRKARRNEEFSRGGPAAEPAYTPNTGEFIPPRPRSENRPLPGIQQEDPCSPALLTLLELAVNSETAARQIAELVPPEELPDSNPIARAVNLTVNLALNGEFEQVPAELSELLIEHPVPEISRILVSEFVCKDIPTAVEESAAELRRQFKKEEQRLLMLQMKNASTPEERLALLTRLQSMS